MPKWLSAVLREVVVPVVREVVRAELEALRLRHAPASPTSPDATGPDVVREVPR